MPFDVLQCLRSVHEKRRVANLGSNDRLPDTAVSKGVIPCITPVRTFERMMKQEWRKEELMSVWHCAQSQNLTAHESTAIFFPNPLNIECSATRLHLSLVNFSHSIEASPISFIEVFDGY